MMDTDLTDVKRTLANSGYPGLRISELRGLNALSRPLPADDDVIQQILQTHSLLQEQPAAE